MDDHDLTMKHENQLNGSDGLMGRMNDVEVWKNKYLLSDRKETCIGIEELEKYKIEQIKSKEGEVEMTKAKVSSMSLIMVALIGAIPSILLLLMTYFKK